MPYDLSVGQRALIRSRFKCEACGRHWCDLPQIEGDAPIDAHSSYSFHLVMDEETGLYRATSVPYAFRRLKGRLYDPRLFRVYHEFDERRDDAFSLCTDCHKRVHAIAREWTKRLLGPKREFRNEIPNVLEYVTVEYVKSGAKWTPF